MFSVYWVTAVLHVVQARPESPEAHSPGQWTQAVRPERAEALSPGKALKKVPNFKCRAYF